MDYISCKICKGTGFVDRIKLEYCTNNIDRLAYHRCYKCENKQEHLKGKYMLCKYCNGDGYYEIIQKKK